MNSTIAEPLETRFPAVFDPPFTKRFGPILLIVGIVCYLGYAVWFFNLPKVLGEAHWERMGIYLAQWVSFDERPEFRLGGDTISVRYPGNSSLGVDPHPDWIHNEADGRIAVEVDGPSSMVVFGRNEADIVHAGETARLALTGNAPSVIGDTPEWLKVFDDEVFANMGFAGDVRVSVDRIKVRKKFLGWANFVFDADSPFFGRPALEIAGLIAAGPDLVESKPNWALAFDNIWNNAQWQHGDVWTKLLQTIVMAFVGTLLGAIVAFPLAFLAARNITANGFANQLFKRVFDFMRSIDMLIWALFFTRAFGPGPLAGSAAIFFTEIGTLGKVYSEGLENIDDRPREGVQSTGAHELLVQRYGVLPQIAPVFVSQTLYQWESNTRGATIIGAVGAGGIGLKLWEAMRTNSNWANVFYMVLLILAVVMTFDSISNALRSRLIAPRGVRTP